MSATTDAAEETHHKCDEEAPAGVFDVFWGGEWSGRVEASFDGCPVEDLHAFGLYLTAPSLQHRLIELRRVGPKLRPAALVRLSAISAVRGSGTR